MSYPISFEKIARSDSGLFDNDASTDGSSYLLDTEVVDRLSQALEHARNEIAKQRKNDEDE